MTDADWLSLVRSLINEPTGKFWSDTEIALYKSMGIIAVRSNFASLLYERYKKFTLGSLTASDPYITIPSDCEIPGKVALASTGQALKYIDDAQVHKWEQNTSQYPLAWMFENSKIRLLPTPAVSSSNYLRIWYLPTVSTLAGLPEVLHPLIAMEAVLCAKIKDEDVKNDIMAQHARFSEIARTFLVTAQLQSSGSIEDYEDDLQEDWT